MATHADTTPTPLSDRYTPAAHPVTVRFRIPAKDRRRRPDLIEGILKGVMHMRGAIHHYRVAGADGVLYLAPPRWFGPQHINWFTGAAFAPPMEPGSLASELAMLMERWDSRLPNAPQPEGAA